MIHLIDQLRIYSQFHTEQNYLSILEPLCISIVAFLSYPYFGITVCDVVAVE